MFFLIFLILTRLFFLNCIQSDLFFQQFFEERKSSKNQFVVFYELWILIWQKWMYANKNALKLHFDGLKIKPTLDYDRSTFSLFPSLLLSFSKRTMCYTKHWFPPNYSTESKKNQTEHEIYKLNFNKKCHSTSSKCLSLVYNWFWHRKKNCSYQYS